MTFFDDTGEVNLVFLQDRLEALQQLFCNTCRVSIVTQFFEDGSLPADAHLPFPDVSLRHLKLRFNLADHVSFYALPMPKG